jgi:16S rRNA (cytosine1407-C5)-methyltransferase
MKRKKKATSPPLDKAALVSEQLARFQPLLSPGEFKRLESTLDHPLSPAIRLNLLKAKHDLTTSLQHRYGWQCTPVEFCPTGFRVDTQEGPALSDTLEYKNGLYYIQEATSMLPVELFSFENPQETLILDMAASPGGKTTHLVSRMLDKGLILANDSSQGRIQALRIVLQHWGAENTAITRFPGESFGSWFPEVFDRVLIDAPCSMQGLRTTESHPARPVTPKESRQLAKRQAALLTSALQAVRVDGEVVYSTCTLAPEEDEEVVETVLETFGSSITHLDAQKILPEPAPGIKTNRDEVFQANMENTIRLWPHRYNTAGFFASLFYKNDNFETKLRPAPSHSMEKAGFVELPFKDQKVFSLEFEEGYGFPLWDYLSDHRRTLIRRDDKVFVFPRMLLERFADLPVQSAGLHLCNVSPEGIIPTFDWATRFGHLCKTALLILENNQSSIWLEGKDLEGVNGTIKQPSPIRMVVDQNGQFIGRGKLVQGVLKNLDYNRYR